VFYAETDKNVTVSHFFVCSPVDNEVRSMNPKNINDCSNIVHPDANSSQMHHSDCIRSQDTTGVENAGQRVRDSEIRTGKSLSFWKGASLGLLLGATLLAVAVWQRPAESQSLQLPPELLKASATHGTNNFAVATGQVSDEAEGVFFLDFLTGELTCWVYYPRIQQFNAKFTTNVTAAFPAAAQNPTYLLATGTITGTRGVGNARPGGCLVYVVEPTSGTFVAYAVPWNRAVENQQAPQANALVVAGGGQVSSRGGAIRDK
jgi:hypothetical protein